MITMLFQAKRDESTLYERPFSYSDEDMARILAAYQTEANTAVNGTASVADVLQYMINRFAELVEAKVQTFEVEQAQARAAAAVQALRPIE